MPRLPDMKLGTELSAYKRSVPFSFWPTRQTLPRPTVQSLLFALDPWVMMRRSIAEQVALQSSRTEAFDYIEQAHDFYSSAISSSVGAAKPVQLYYSFLNIAKAFIICRGIQPSLPTIRHGISESKPQQGREFFDGTIQMHPSPDVRGNLQAYDEFMRALGHRPLAGPLAFPITKLVPQILSGHRLWASAAGEQERFIALQHIDFMENKTQREIWIRIYIFQGDIARLGYSQDKVLREGGLHPKFRKVKCSKEVDGKPLICLEQEIPDTYGRHGVDLALGLAGKMSDKLWTTVGSSPPYRRYYLYVCPPADRPSLLPQIASIYALMFYLGSVTRYRPNVFRSLLDEEYGPRIEEFLSAQPLQYIYLMASEFARRDITRPSIV